MQVSDSSGLVPRAAPDRRHLNPDTVIVLVTATLTSFGDVRLEDTAGQQLYELRTRLFPVPGGPGRKMFPPQNSPRQAQPSGGGTAQACRLHLESFTWVGNPEIPWHMAAEKISAWMQATFNLRAEVVVRIPAPAVTAEQIVHLSADAEWVLVADPDPVGGMSWRNNHANFTEFAAGDVLHDGAVVLCSHQSIHRAATDDEQWVYDLASGVRRLHIEPAALAAAALNAGQHRAAGSGQ